MTPTSPATNRMGRARQAPQREGRDALLDRAFLLTVATAGLAFFLPLLPVAGIVYGALWETTLQATDELAEVTGVTERPQVLRVIGG